MIAGTVNAGDASAGNSNRTARGTIAVVASIYLAWVSATYLLEGSRHTLLRPDARFDRLGYAVVANVVAGTLLPLLALRTLAAQRCARARLGRSGTAACTAVSVVAATLLGLCLVVPLLAAGRHALVVPNVFAQVLPTSVAEVVICWVLVGAAVQVTAGNRDSLAAGIATWLAGAALFGIYHVAHSPPYNSPTMLVSLTGVGLVTGAFYFATGELYSTILLHNFLATVGVMSSMSARGSISSLDSPQPLLYLAAATAVGALIVLDVLWFRDPAPAPTPRPRETGSIEPQRVPL